MRLARCGSLALFAEPGVWTILLTPRSLALVFVLGMACGVMAVDGVLRWFVY